MLFIAWSGLLSVASMAQIQLVATSPESLSVLGSLSSGTRYIGPLITPQSVPGTRIIYNLDLSVHRVLNFPAPPAGMQWYSMGYITEALFDDDPSTIEFTMVAGAGSSFATYVFREDGSVVFQRNPGNLTNGPIFTEAYGPIFSTPEGTFMTVHTTGPVGGPVEVYRLPGQLPCLDCYGAPQGEGVTGGGMVLEPPTHGFVLVPNPAGNDVQVVVDRSLFDPEELTVMDASGREVLRLPAAGSSTLHIPLSGLANGRYVVTLWRAAKPLGGRALLIAR